MQHEPNYPTAPRSSTFREGVEFQDWVCLQLARRHVILQNLASKRYQIEVGENLQGFEIKLDLRCSDTGRLSIEIAEKSNAANAEWVASGIMRADNSWLYIQGNYQALWIFAKSQLRRFYQVKRPDEHESYGTVRKFYLSIRDADTIAALVLRGADLT